MAALINLALGAYLVPAHRPGARLTQRIGSALIAIGSVLLTVSFFYDAPHADLVPSISFSANGESSPSPAAVCCMRSQRTASHAGRSAD
jgi:hypothetical protein